MRSIRPALECSARPLTLGRIFGRIKRQINRVRSSLAELGDVELRGDAMQRLDRVESEWLGLAIYLGHVPGSEPPPPLAARATRAEAPREGVPDPRRPNEQLLRSRDWANQRKYDKAESQLNELLHQLVGWRLSDDLAKAFKEWRGYRPERTKLHLAIRCLKNLHLLRLYRAEALRCLTGHIGQADVARARSLQAKRDEHLAAADNIYRLAADHLRYVEDLPFLHEQNAFLRANAGVALASQRRYTEANRKYNEAYSRLNQLSGPSLALRFATVDMRRAEAALFKLEEAELGVAGPSGALQEPTYQTRERCLGVLYDAIASVDRAAYKAGGETASPAWYSWLYELELRVCVQLLKEAREAKRARLGYSVQELFARCRDGVSVGEWFCTSLDNALFVVGGDIFRIARYVDLTQRFLALAPATHLDEQQQLERAERLLGRASELLVEASSGDKELDPIVVEYAQRVQSTATHRH